MTLEKRSGVSLADAKAALAEVETTYRERRKTLKALIRVLEAEQEPDDAKADA